MLPCILPDLLRPVAEVDLVNHSDCSVHPPGVFLDRSLGRLVRSFRFD
jgi:hypothetical protein